MILYILHRRNDLGSEAWRRPRGFRTDRERFAFTSLQAHLEHIYGE
jgi:hypothetical protein